MTNNNNFFSETIHENEAETIEYGSQNVFADLGLDNAEELYVRAQLGMQILAIIKERQYQQNEAATVLGITCPEVSALCCGKFNRFSVERLIGLLNKLDWKIQIKLSPRVKNEPFQAVDYA